MNETETYNSSIGQLIEPEPIAFSFNTLGWYIVLAVLLLIVLVIAFIRFRRYKKNAYRREAEAKIAILLQQKGGSVIVEINTILKIMALQIFGRKRVASLYGSEWFGFLNSTINSENKFAEKEVEKFTNSLYNPNEKLDEKVVTEFTEFAVLWIKNHNANV